MTPRQAKRTTPTGDLVKTYGERIEMIPLDRLKPYPRNARIHSRKQIGQIADSLQRFGFTNPVLVDDGNMILAGLGRVEAAKLIGMTAVPCLRLSSMSAAEKRAYVLAENKLALNAGWDDDILAGELKLILDDVGEIDIASQALPSPSSTPSSIRPSLGRRRRTMATTPCPTRPPMW